MFKRFRDSVTGLFVSRKEATARPRETYGTYALKVSDLQLLNSALRSSRDYANAGDYREALRVLDRAVWKVLDPEG